jgi:hypothetical protein
LLLVSTLLSGGLMALPADAANVQITTTGMITSGSETGGLFGLPATTTSLVGDSYTLIVNYLDLGPGYYTAGDGSFASATGSITGYVKAFVNGGSITAPLTNSLGASLFEDLYSLGTGNQGTDASGNYVNVAQSLSCTTACVPYANLLTPFLYSLGPSDFGVDTFTYGGAGGAAASFFGAPTSLDFQVPEPASWALLATGLLGIGMLARRRRA